MKQDAYPPLLKAKSLASGEWVVRDEAGKQIACGFDNQAEAEEWIAEQSE